MDILSRLLVGVGVVLPRLYGDDRVVRCLVGEDTCDDSDVGVDLNGEGRSGDFAPNLDGEDRCDDRGVEVDLVGEGRGGDFAADFGDDFAVCSFFGSIAVSVGGSAA